MDDKRILNDAVAVVKEQGYAMRQAMSHGNIRDVLKFSSALLSELRSSTLSPRAYFELYLAAVSELNVLHEFFRDPTKRKRRIRDLYETVQLAGNVLPRLYLLASVGSVCIQEKAGSIVEVLDDMTALGAGVQHPTRGLFYRYYLVSLTKKCLSDDGDEWSGEVQDIAATNAMGFDFLLSNLVEASRLWARISFQPFPADKTKREREKLALRPLLKSMLDVMTEFKWFSNASFLRVVAVPRLIASIVAMRDPQAQQYLFGCLIEIIRPETLLRTPEGFFRALVSLNPALDMKLIYEMVLHKLRLYLDETPSVNTELTSDPPPPTATPYSEAASLSADGAAEGDAVQALPESLSPRESSVQHLPAENQTDIKPSAPGAAASSDDCVVTMDSVVCVYRSAREALMDLIQKSYEQDFAPLPTAKATVPYYLQISDLLSMIHSLTLFSLSAPLINRPHFVEGVLHLLVPLIIFVSNAPDESRAHLLSFVTQIMSEPFCASAQLNLLTNGDFKLIWSSLPPPERQRLARAICRSVARHHCMMNSLAVLSSLLELCLPPLAESLARATSDKREWHADASTAAALIHLAHVTASVDDTYAALVILQDAFTDHANQRIRRYVGPALLHRLFALLKKCNTECISTTEGLPQLIVERIRLVSFKREVPANSLAQICLHWMKSGESHWKDTTVDQTAPTEFLFREVLRCAAEFAIIVQASKTDGPVPSIANSYIDGNLVFAFVKEALVQFEEVSDIRRKNSSLLLLVKFLSTYSTALRSDDCNFLASRITKYTSKLLRSGEQAQVILQCTHMFWGTAIEDAKKCIECLQRALQLAHAAANFEPRDTGLFIDVLEKYLFFLERRIVTQEAFSSLLTLCKEHLEFAAQTGVTMHEANPSCHYRNVVAKLHRCGHSINEVTKAIQLV